MALGILTLVTALTISAVAIYYSVAGLMTIFAAAAIPIMIMGGALEIGKLVTAVWLHRYWSKATWWLRTYLTTAVVVLMFITSMGIFGFLSKAHIEQTANAEEGIAQLERIESEIARNEQVVARAENKIEELETQGTGASNQIQQQIDREQARIENAYERIQPAIDEQNQIIQDATALYQSELDRIDEELQRLQEYIDNNQIEQAQAMVGTAVDGDYGPNTAAAFQEYQDAKRTERSQWLERIQSAAQSPVVQAAREEITRLRARAEEQIAESNALINSLRAQLKADSGNQLQTLLSEQNDRIRTASSEIDLLLDQKFQLEAEYRKLEAEVGPVKYIAEFIYGETADKNLLEEAVRWVIIVIIFVFDPLAVLLLIASQYTFTWHRQEKPDTQKQTESYSSEEPNSNHDTAYSQSANDSDIDDAEEIVSSPDYKPIDTADEQPLENVNALSTNEVARDYSLPAEEKKDTESWEELKQNRTQELAEQDNDVSWSEAKKLWKEAHPDATLKEFKEKYVHGIIDRLPWEDYLADESKKKTYMIKKGLQQIKKTTDE